VFREFHRHRIGFSYNETSGRYSQLQPKFYIPAFHRPLVQTGKPGQYTYTEGTQEQHEQVCSYIETSCKVAYDIYLHLLDIGIAKEVARGVLPVYIYSSMYVTCNARSLMSFLSLRSRDDSSAFRSYPMWEIEQVALQMEQALLVNMPITHRYFRELGSVSP
jgi:thymidylate synthase (FAD)